MDKQSVPDWASWKVSSLWAMLKEWVLEMRMAVKSA